MQANLPCIVIGGGIGGLAAALALLRSGLDVRVYEQAARLGEVGAGLTLSKGAQKCCAHLGIAAAVRTKLTSAAGFVFVHYRTGEQLAAMPPASGGVQDGHIYRADLHGILAQAVRAYGDDRIVLGHALAGVAQDAQQVTARFTNGATASAAVLIGADGLRSAVRREIFGEGAPAFTHRVAYRFMLPAETALPLLDVGGTACLFVGPGSVFNRYLVSGGRLLNCAAFRRDDAWTEDGWHVPAAIDELLHAFAGWHPSVLALMRRAPPERLIKWGIFARPPRFSWVDGRVALLGDAAHPMQPFLGLGAAMAIEDATILGRAFAAAPDATAALAAYERARVPRANQVLALSRMQGDLFDSTDPADFPPKNAPSHDPALADFDPESPLN